tara:strand:- start:238 stop:441 length:204 start_codon:yes stop_codon:yes gene_type:complete
MAFMATTAKAAAKRRFFKFRIWVNLMQSRFENRMDKRGARKELKANSPDCLAELAMNTMIQQNHSRD